MVIKIRFLSFKRSFKTLSKAYKFHPNLPKNGEPWCGQGLKMPKKANVSQTDGQTDQPTD